MDRNYPFYLDNFELTDIESRPTFWGCIVNALNNAAIYLVAIFICFGLIGGIPAIFAHPQNYDLMIRFPLAVIVIFLITFIPYKAGKYCLWLYKQGDRLVIKNFNSPDVILVRRGRFDFERLQ